MRLRLVSDSGAELCAAPLDGSVAEATYVPRISATLEDTALVVPAFFSGVRVAAPPRVKVTARCCYAVRRVAILRRSRPSMWPALQKGCWWKPSAHAVACAAGRWSEECLRLVGGVRWRCLRRRLLRAVRGPCGGHIRAPGQARRNGHDKFPHARLCAPSRAVRGQERRGFPRRARCNRKGQGYGRCRNVLVRARCAARRSPLGGRLRCMPHWATGHRAAAALPAGSDRMPLLRQPRCSP